jgi:RNA polymerase sigma-B factor
MAPASTKAQLPDQLRTNGASKSDDPDTRAEHTHRLLVQARSARPAERQKLHEEVVLLNLEVAETLVLRYRNRGVSHDDLVQIACLGLVKAAQGFDPDKSDNFLSYAVPTILGEVKRFFRDNAWVVRPPRRVQELQAAINEANERLSQTNGRAPTAEQIAEETGAAVGDVREALSAAGCFTPSSLDRSGTDDPATPTWADMLGSRERGFDRVEAAAVLQPLTRRLSPRDQRILYLRFFHEWTQAKIAAELGVTQMQVSRLLARILGQLRAAISDDERHGRPLRPAS